MLALHAGPIDFGTLPFANVAELLHQVPLPVPRILGHSNDAGLIALEDLGDVTLQAHLGAASTTEHAALYREAVALVEQLQRRGTELAADRYLPYGIAFTSRSSRGSSTSSCASSSRGTGRRADGGRARSAVERMGGDCRGAGVRSPRAVPSRLSQPEPDAPCRTPVIIDFQDARMGPDTYDLVSLLRDSYVDLTDRELDELIAYFLALKGGGDPVDFRRRFDLMALQRNLKALGTFGYQTIARGNTVYIQYIPRTLATRAPTSNAIPASRACASCSPVISKNFGRPARVLRLRRPC